MDINNELFTEKYRPKSLDRMLLLPRIKSELEKGLIQNTILASATPGSGKTTAARILCKGKDVLYLNGSVSGIDAVKEDIARFGSTMSVLSDDPEEIKVVYIDEADGLTRQAWDALRETIEHYAETIRFVLTCNKLNKIPDFIQSRFNVISFYPINKEEENMLLIAYCKYTAAILRKHGIECDDTTVELFVKNNFPDMRSILNGIQSMVIKGVAQLDASAIQKSFDYSELFNLIIMGGDPEQNYIFVRDNFGNNVEDAMYAMGEQLVEYLRINYPEKKNVIPYLLISIEEQMYKFVDAPNKLVAFLGTCFKYQQIMNTFGR